MKRQRDLKHLLEKEKAVPKAVAALIRALDAKRTYVQNGKPVTEDDSSTQVKAAVALLSWAEGPPMPKTPPTPEAKLGPDEVRILLRERLVAALTAPGARLGDLVQAEKALQQEEKKAPARKFTEAELIAHARQVHGMVPLDETTDSNEAVAVATTENNCVEAPVSGQ